MCESRGGRLGFPVPNKPDGFCGQKDEINTELELRRPELRNCVKVEVAVLGSASLISLMVFVDRKTKSILSLKSDAQSSGAV